MSGEQAIFNLQIKKKSGLSLNPNIHHSKVFSSDIYSELLIIWTMVDNSDESELLFWILSIQ